MTRRRLQIAVGAAICLNIIAVGYLLYRDYATRQASRSLRYDVGNLQSEMTMRKLEIEIIDDRSKRTDGIARDAAVAAGSNPHIHDTAPGQCIAGPGC